MKLILSAAMTLMFSLNTPVVMADPAVGDSSTYDAVITANGESKTFVLKEEFIAINTTEDKVTVKQTLSQNGTVVSEENAEITITSLEQIDYIVDHCAEIGNSGQLPAGTTLNVENITVTAGTFSSCHLKSAEQNVYLGHVPTGTIKSIGKLSSGADLVLTLTAFTKR